MNRIFKYINYLVAAAAVIAASAGGWIVYRALPDAAGSIQAPVSASGTISRDRHGVVRIVAASEEDAYFLQGYATAQDRLFQMDLGRRLGAGEVAEVAGRNAIDTDIEARRLRMRGLAAHYARTIDQRDFAPLAAYARGVNHFLETHRSRLPVEFHLLRYDPAPWTVADSLITGLQMYRALTTDWRRELARNAFRGAADAVKVQFLLDPAPAPIAAAPPGSNAFAVAGTRTVSGRPLLASDPHLAPTLPPIWHQVQLKAGNLDVAGAALPGLPGVAIGHNGAIAWGITSLGFDEQDLFPPASPVRATQRETIRVRGGTAVEVAIPLTAEGPLVPSDDNRLWTLRWSGAEHAKFAYPFPELNKARNWDEFRAALSRHPGPGFRFVYADSEGNIGTQVAGRLPLRGANGAWTGTIPFADLPYELNPAGGLAVAANENPFPPGYPYPVSGRFAEGYRAAQIRARLIRKSKLTAEDMLSIQRDIYSAPIHEVARIASKACAREGGCGEAAKILESWTGRMEAESAGACLAYLVTERLRRAVADAAAPGHGDNYAEQVRVSALLRLLEQRPRDWFPNYDSTIAKAVADAVAEGRKTFGGEITSWRWGGLHTITLRLPVVSELWWIGSRFRVGPVEEGGEANTVRQVTARAMPSMRFVADAGDWENSGMTLPGGQSGLVFSGHWNDQWEVWQAGRLLPFPREKFEARKTMRVEPSH